MKQHFSRYKADFLLPDETNFPTLLARTSYLHTCIASQVQPNVPRVPMPDGQFAYSASQRGIPQRGRSSNEVLRDLADAFQGSIRWNQPTALMNIAPTPLLDCVAASTIASLYNVNSLWDYNSGNVTRYEKEVVAFLCHLAGWDATRAAGLSTSGGKATLMYAIRCGLSECDRQSVTHGLNGEYAVIASKNAHYSLEDICNYLGIGRANVIRVTVDADGAMNPGAFEKALRESLVAGKKIAAIVALGGDTLDHIIDPVRQLRVIRDAVAEEYALGYKPFLHLDSVNAWVALAFREYNFAENALNIESQPLTSIRTLARNLSEVMWADAFSADFHKTGLAPYVSSFFIAKSGAHLHSINKSVLLSENPSHIYGEVHTHHISFENSRSANGIVAAWTSLQRLGIEGYQRYWAQLMTVSTHLKQIITMKYHTEMTIVNTTALGHPIVVQLHPTALSPTYDELLTNKRALETYRTYCFELYNYMAYRLLPSEDPYPLLGFVPNYKLELSGIGRPAFLIYANHPFLSDRDCDALLERILALKHDFEKNRSQTARRLHAMPEHLPK